MLKIDTSEGVNLYKKAKKLIPGGTQLLSKRPELFLPDMWPSYYKKAKGCEIWDLDNNHFYDITTSGIGACLLGFADEDVNAAVKDAVHMGNMCTLNTPVEVELAELLCDIHPWANRARFARTGGEIMAMAVRIARAASARDKIAFCGYHGWHDWYLAANLAGDSKLNAHLLPGLEPNGVPKSLKDSVLPFHYNNIDELQEIFDNNHGEIGAVVMEPVRYNMPENNFLHEVRKLTEKYNAVLVFDEITSGWRFSIGGVHLKLGVEPDIAVFAKAISNGFPMAAVIGKEDIMDAAQSSFLSSTYWTEAIGPAAALATIKKMQRLNLPEIINSCGEKIINGWKELLKKHELPAKIKGLPALCGFAFDHPESQMLKTILTYEMLQKGFLSTLSVYPTLAHTDEIIRKYLDNLDNVFGTIKKLIEKNNIKEQYNFLKEAHKGFARLT